MAVHMTEIIYYDGGTIKCLALRSTNTGLVPSSMDRSHGRSLNVSTDPEIIFLVTVKIRRFDQSESGSTDGCC